MERKARSVRDAAGSLCGSDRAAAARFTVRSVRRNRAQATGDRKTSAGHKPVIGVYLLADETTRTVIEIEGQKYKGIVFPSPGRVVKSLSMMFQYAQ